jgi:hypothetical protein
MALLAMLALYLSTVLIDSRVSLKPVSREGACARERAEMGRTPVSGAEVQDESFGAG